MNSKYLALIRVHQPVPYVLLFAPIFWVLALGGVDLWQNIMIFAFGTFLMRSCGCIINDIIDQNIDKHCLRTSARPIASGQISTQRAIVFLAILLVFAAVLLLFLPRESLYIACIVPLLMIIYPFSKRFIFCPQLILGIVFNIGMFIAWFTQREQIAVHIMIYMYLSAVFWTMGYDSFYGHQDVDDDKRIGVKSIAVTFEKNLNAFVWALYKICFGFLLIIGFQWAMNPLYFCLVLLGLYCLYKQIDEWDVSDKVSSKNIFTSNYLFAFIMSLAFFIGK